MCKKPAEFFSEKEEQSLFMQLVLKTAKKPEGLNSPAEIEAYYQNEQKAYYWHFAYQKNNRFYFFISRPAPSLYGKRSGIAGYFESENKLSVKAYHESFHTFKFIPAELEKKGTVLFQKLVKGEDLTAYQPGGKKTGNSEWIEFPDAAHYYDANSQSWKTRIGAPSRP